MSGVLTYPPIEVFPNKGLTLFPARISSSDAAAAVALAVKAVSSLPGSCNYGAFGVDLMIGAKDKERVGSRGREDEDEGEEEEPTTGNTSSNSSSSSSSCSSSIWIKRVAAFPHRWGNYTLGCFPVSQFDAHIRAILELPLPPTLTPAHSQGQGQEQGQGRHYCCCVDIIAVAGDIGATHAKAFARHLLQFSRCQVHWYGSEVELSLSLTTAGANAATTGAGDEGGERGRGRGGAWTPVPSRG